MESIYDKKKSIIQMHRDGKSAYEIARAHEISLMAVYESLDQAEKEESSDNGSRAEKRKAQVSEMKSSGMKRKEIADRLNVSISTVNRVLSDGDYHFFKAEQSVERYEPTPNEKKQLELIRSKFENGDTQSSLVRKTGLSVVTVNKLFRKFHLKDEFGMDEAYIRAVLSAASRKGQRKANKNRAKKKNMNKKKAMKMLDEGMSVDAVARELGMSVATIKRYQKEENNTDNKGTTNNL